MAVPPAPAPIQATPEAQLDSELKALRAHADAFAKRSISDYRSLLASAREGLDEVAEELVRAACGAKGIDFEDPVSGEEWLAGPMMIMRNIRLLDETLASLEKTGHPPELKEKHLSNGQRAARVFPYDLKDKLLFAGFEAWVWLEPGEEQGPLSAHMAEAYRNPPAQGHVSLILGAGNVASIPPMDAFYKLFVERRVVLVKMNPVNEYLGPFFERALSRMIEEGCLRIVYGGGEVGAYLCNHDEVDDIHITGSNHTHDLIVWGPPGPERERRKTEGEPVLDKPITSELGNVSPVMIVPGDYTDKELRFVAENVATQLTNNGGFNCNAAKVLVTASGWAQRERFIGLFEEVLGEIPTRPAYYPGAEERHDTWTQDQSEVDTIGQQEGERLPWALIRDLDPSDPDQRCFTEEAFCGVLAETALPADDALAFIKEAVPFANDVLWGTLNCCLIIDPRTEKRPEVSQALDQAIEALRFGAVVINHWPAVAYGFVSTPWGGHAGATLRDVQSGIGWVHNSFMLDKPQKSVIRGPLVVNPKPPWFRTHRNCHNVGRKLVDFERSGSFWAVPGVALAAMKG